MPLDPNAKPLIEKQLELIAQGRPVSVIAIGALTPEQFTEINRIRAELDYPPLGSSELVYFGKHHHKSRSADGYTNADLLLQIQSALAATSRVHMDRSMTVLEASVRRLDSYGNLVLDRAVLELTQRKPRAEVYSVIPKGDGGGPKNRKAPA